MIDKTKLENIRRCEDYWRELFAEKLPFNDCFDRWYNPNLPDQYTTNAFFPKGAVTAEALAEAYAYQRDLGFLQLMCKEPLDRALAEEFQLKENIVLTMALLGGNPDQWQENKTISIADVQEQDISEDIIAFQVAQEDGESDYPLRAITQDMKAAAAYPEYHWLAAYQNGDVAAVCHALCYSGCVEIDDLVVAPAARKQYIATSLLKYIAEHFEGQLYLHADEDDTPRDLYSRLGFEVVDKCWEYRRLWKTK